MISVVELMAGEEIDVKATKVVAGLECEKTNAFLQILFQVATSGADASGAVAQVTGKGGEEGGHEEEHQEAQDDGGAEEAQRAAEEEEARKQQDEEEDEQRRKQERREKKKKMMEEKKRKKDEEDQMRAQQEEEEERHTDQQEQPKGKQNRPSTPSKRPSKNTNVKTDDQVSAHPPANVIREGDNDDDGEGDNEQVQQDEGIDYNNVDPSSKFAKDAMAQMRQQEEEDQVKDEDDNNGGGGIKLGRLGNRKKKGQAAGAKRSAAQKVGINQPPTGKSNGAYNQNDVSIGQI